MTGFCLISFQFILNFLVLFELDALFHVLLSNDQHYSLSLRIREVPT